MKNMSYSAALAEARSRVRLVRQGRDWAIHTYVPRVGTYVSGSMDYWRASAARSATIADTVVALMRPDHAGKQDAIVSEHDVERLGRRGAIRATIAYLDAAAKGE